MVIFSAKAFRLNMLLISQSLSLTHCDRTIVRSSNDFHLFWSLVFMAALTVKGSTWRYRAHRWRHYRLCWLVMDSPFNPMYPESKTMEFHLSLSSLSNVKQVREFFLIFSMCLYESVYQHFWRQHHTRKETFLSTHFQKLLTLPLSAWPIFRSPPDKGAVGAWGRKRSVGSTRRSLGSSLGLYC